MTWCAKVTKADGTTRTSPGATAPDYSACQSCKHGKGQCYIPKVTSALGSILTSVDRGSDDHMASGTAELRCNGYEEVEIEPHH